MNTLIIFATKHGCTENCAQDLAEKLTGTVDLCNLKTSKAPDLTKYDKIIVGGSIYIGKIQKDVTEFCQANQATLKEKTLGLFICCMQTGEQAETQLKNSFTEELLDHATAKQVFGGAFYFKKMGFLDRFIIKMVSKNDPEKGPIDPKNDLIEISQENINCFAQLMNTA